MVVNYCISKLSLSLCAGDISSGYIPLNPVLGNRKQIIEERIDFYLNVLPERYAKWCERLSEQFSSPSIREKLLYDISIIINADMVSGAIPLQPVLTERDIMIFQSFDTYIDIILAKPITGMVQSISENNSSNQLIFTVKN
ncbi:hypothetical protein QBG92_004774, partial [Salmonella enterica]|nr:hypothetical protein [Salmonella enterica]